MADHNFPIDERDDDEYPGSECGRWRNGRLVHDCLKAGTEECQFDCPYARTPTEPPSQSDPAKGE